MTLATISRADGRPDRIAALRCGRRGHAPRPAAPTRGRTAAPMLTSAAAPSPEIGSCAGVTAAAGVAGSRPPAPRNTANSPASRNGAANDSVQPAPARNGDPPAPRTRQNVERAADQREQQRTDHGAHRPAGEHLRAEGQIARRCCRQRREPRRAPSSHRAGPGRTRPSEPTSGRAAAAGAADSPSADTSTAGTPAPSSRPCAPAVSGSAIRAICSVSAGVGDRPREREGDAPPRPFGAAGSAPVRRRPTTARRRDRGRWRRSRRRSRSPPRCPAGSSGRDGAHRAGAAAGRDERERALRQQVAVDRSELEQQSRSVPARPAPGR